MSAHKERPILFSGPMVRAILEGRKTQTRRVVTLGSRFQQSNTPGYDFTWLGTRRGGTRGGGAGCWQDMTREQVLALCPYGAPGDRLWVRETFCWKRDPISAKLDGFHYAADGVEVRKTDGDGYSVYRKDGTEASPWISSLRMPREASRLTLEVKAVRVERVQEIMEADAKAEGATRREIAGRSAGWSMDWSRVGRESRFAGGIHPRGKGQPLTEGDVCLGSARMAFGNLWNSINAKRGFGWNANPWVWVIEFERVNP